MIGSDVFQEIDIFGIILSIVKYFYVVCSVVDMVCIVIEVFYFVSIGCFGLVLIDIFKDVGLEECEYIFFDFGDVNLLGYCFMVKGNF